MIPRKVVIEFTTDASGDATVYTDAIVGRIHSILYDPGDVATGADLTITTETTEQAVLTITNAGTSAVRWSPRLPTHDLAGAAETYDGTEPVNDSIVAVDERIKIVVDEGGNAKTGTVTVIVA
jgi:hypothetical protein